MGFDTVELVMEVEETFGIKIPDQEASEIVTVGDLFEYVLRKLEYQDSVGEHKKSVVCLSSAAFYRLRRGLMETFGTKRSLVRPASRVEELLPKASRRQVWSLLSQALELRLPGLKRPPALNAVMLFTLLIGPLVVFGFLSRSPFFKGDLRQVPFLLACFLYALLPVIGILITRPFQRHLAPDCQTVRGLTETLLRLNYVKLAVAKSAINRDEIWTALKTIIVEQLGVKPEEVTAGASFVRDLGLG